jgi:hypothetical protein
MHCHSSIIAHCRAAASHTGYATGRQAGSPSDEPISLQSRRSRTVHRWTIPLSSLLPFKLSPQIITLEISIRGGSHYGHELGSETRPLNTHTFAISSTSRRITLHFPFSASVLAAIHTSVRQDEEERRSTNASRGRGVLLRHTFAPQARTHSQLTSYWRIRTMWLERRTIVNLLPNL